LRKLERHPLERAALLQEACKDEVVQAEVQALLAEEQHYNVTEKLGEGGMGIVYKARDTRLDRFVALKVLQPGVIADPERKRRFMQEARAASALNHPNIITIHDIVHETGSDFLVMEYLSGNTLEALIKGTGLQLKEALNYAIQIVDALAKAHSAGIIHRDLKPSNIMVTADGVLKVLDFGLAKLVEQAEEGLQSKPAKTFGFQKPQTEAGTIAGTPAYMSPEQVQGKAVDARSDIFSFGAVLYEMITAAQPFRGKDQLARAEPEPVRALAPATPIQLETLILRALCKDPEVRWQSMTDLKVALGEVLEDVSRSNERSLTTATFRWHRPAVAIPFVVLTILIGVMALWRLADKQSRPLTTITLTSFSGVKSHPALSPDGKHLAFDWDGEHQDNTDIYVTLAGGRTPLRLTRNSAADLYPAWSPDGRHIAFIRSYCNCTSEHQAAQSPADIIVIPSSGGPERLLTHPKMPGTGNGLAWSPDGRFLAITDSTTPKDPGAIFLVKLATGTKQRLTSPPASSSGDRWPSFSPDGRALAFE
jgi:serine/threonine protein kinase